MKKDIKIFSLARHRRLFAVPDNSRDYLFVQVTNHPYPEEPYRAESYALAYLKKGSIQFHAGLTVQTLQAPTLIAVGPTVIRSFSKSSEVMEMDIIFFKDTFLLENYADLQFLNKFAFFENADLHLRKLQDTQTPKFDKLFELIQYTQATASYHQAETTRHYIFALIYEIDAYYRQHTAATNLSLTGYVLFSGFKQLLNGNYMQERKLDFYANRLHVMPKSLSAAVKKQTGKSAGKWIAETIALEAKVLLQNKTLTVSQISSMLHFSDQSVFGKFFRANASMSPVAYRKKIL